MSKGRSAISCACPRLKSSRGRRTHARLIVSVASTTAALLLGRGALSAQAASGTWTNTAGGNWSNTANWTGGIVASGASNTADFSTVVPTGSNTPITLDNPYTIGTIKFGSTTTADNWNVSSGAPTNVLTLNNGSSQPVITVSPLLENSTISATIAGTNGFIKTGAGSLTLSGSNTYSGVTTVNSTTAATSNGQSADLYLLNNNALGTSTLFFDPGSTDFARCLIGAGVTIPNNITINTAHASSGTNGALMSNGNVSGATLTGTININAKATSGGTFVGPVDPTFTNFLTFTGPIYLTNTYNTTSGALTNTAQNGIDIRAGNVIFAGGGSYFRVEDRSGMLRVGATNGIATNAYVDLGINSNSNPLTTGVLDLNGFNQTLVGIQNSANGAGFTSGVTNTSTTPAVLTLAPANPSSLSANLVYSTASGAYAAITDNNGNGGTLSLVINGDPLGVQTLNTPNSSYAGSTTLTSGTLNINTLANGGTNSCIGASSNAAANLVFNGGNLNYTGGSISTDRSFITNTGVLANFAVTTTLSSVTITGSGSGGGGFNKTGPGTLIFTGNNTYSGATNVSGGTLLVNNTTGVGIAAASNVNIANGAALGGIGSIGGTVTPVSGATIVPGGAGTVGTLTVGALTLNTGSLLDYEFGGGTNDEITVSNSGGLTINGASIYLYNVGGTTTFSTVGTYPLFNTTGTISGSVANLSIANPAAGKSYAITNNSGVVDLTIASATTIEWNDNAETQNYNDNGNWIGGVVPNGLGETALFGSNLVGSNGTVNIASTDTVSGIIFNNSSVSYTLSGAGSLNLNNGVAATAVDDLNGTHVISVPLAISGATAFTATNSTDSLTIAGNITGAHPITVAGMGAVTLTGTNSFTTVAVNSGTLNIGAGGASGTLGTGGVTLASGTTLNFNTSSSYNFGQTITGVNLGESLNLLGTGQITVGAISAVSSVNVSNGKLVATSINTGGLSVGGSGSLTTSGALSGAAKLTVNTTGTVSLGGTGSYTGGTEVDNGTLTLNAAGALPTLSALAVNGGTLDLHGNNISINNILDTTAGGSITNSVASTTSTISFTGAQSSYNLFASLNDGPTGGKVALISYIENTAQSQNGTQYEYSLISNTAGNYSGGTTVNKESLQANVTNAFGVGPITFNANNASTNNIRLNLEGNVTLPNNITFVQGDPYAGFGDVQYDQTSSGNATLTGSVTLQSDDLNGGTFFGPTAGGNILNVNGPVYTAGTATTIIVRGGNVGFGGGGSYSNLQDFGTLSVNATNGIATNAVLNFSTGTLDLTGNNQTLAGMIVGAGTGVATNSSGTPANLTLNTAAADNYTGQITGNLALIKSGTATLTLSGAFSYTGATQVSGGTLNFPANTNTGFLVDSLPGGLNIGTGGLTTLAVPSATGNRTLLTVSALNFAGVSNAWTGKLDLTSNDLDVQNGNLANVSNQAKVGFAGGTWNGSGGIISTTAANDPNHLTAVGVIQNTLNQLPTGAQYLATFDGQSVSATDILAKFTYYGDTNLDGMVDGSDYSRIDSAFLSETPGHPISGWYNGDFNYDGVVDGSDYTLMDNAFNRQGTSLAAEIAIPDASPTSQLGGAGVSAVPEPASFALTAITAAGLLGRRRRNDR